MSGPATSGRPAVFADRDGTINRNPPRGDFVTRPEDLELLPGAADALRRLKNAGYLIVVFTNQSGVGRGVMSADDVRAVNARTGELLAEAGAPLDGAYFCPHVDADGCECRKPKPGLLTRAAADLGIDLSRSWGIGDGARDLEAARAAGCRVVFVHADAYPGQREAGEALRPEASVPDLGAATEVVLSRGDLKAE